MHRTLLSAVLALIVLATSFSTPAEAQQRSSKSIATTAVDTRTSKCSPTQAPDSFAPRRKSAPSACMMAPPPDLIVSSIAFNPFFCHLSATIKNIGIGTAGASQSVAVLPDDLISGDWVEWNSTALATGDTATVNFGVVEAAGSTLTVKADWMGFQPESNENNNTLTAQTPAACIGTPPPECWTPFFLGSGILAVVDAETFEVEADWPFPDTAGDITFVGHQLWATQIGNKVTNFTLGGEVITGYTSGAFNGYGLATEPGTSTLLIDSGAEVNAFDLTAEIGDEVASGSQYFLAGDLTAYGDEVYASAQSPGQSDFLLRVDLDAGTIETVGPFPVNQISGMAQVTVGDEVQLWASTAFGAVYNIDPATGDGTLIGELGFDVRGMASEPCPDI